MKFICILASSANLRSLQFDKFSTKKFKTLISRILILFKKEKKVGIDECVFAKNGRIISIQFCRKKKKASVSKLLRSFVGRRRLGFLFSALCLHSASITRVTDPEGSTLSK